MRGGPLPRAVDERDQRPTRVSSVGDRRLEGNAGEARADAQVAALGVDADEHRLVPGEAAELACVERHRIGVVAFHMGDDVGLGRGERGGRVKAQVVGGDGVDAPEAGDQMRALERDAVDVKIGEIGVLRGRRVTRQEVRAVARRSSRCAPGR